MKKKICHLTDSHKYNDQRILYKECVSLVQQGYDVTLVACFVPYGLKEIFGVKLIEFPLIPIKNRIIYGNCKMYQTALKINAEIYHIHDPELLITAIKLKKSGRKVIYDAHENYSFQIKLRPYIPMIFKNLSSRVVRMIEDYVSKRIDAVILPCTIFENEELFLKKCKKVVIVGNEPIIPNTLEFKILIKSNKICYVGSLTSERGISQLIKAAFYAKAQLILAGTFVPQEYYNIVKQYPEFSCVDYRGEVSLEESRGIIDECYIGVSTLLNTGQYPMINNLPTKVYEYMSLGKPVIISNFKYVEKVNNSLQFAITVNPESVEEICCAIEKLFNDYDKAKELGLNGFNLIKSIYNWDISKKRLLDLYDSLNM
ncbi:MAG: glycosyltransferase [Spirochaetia bacterium]|nr:glycosyltransferase [Spirochaetia bacterium]